MGGTHLAARRTGAEVGLAGRAGHASGAPVESCHRDLVRSRRRFDSSLAVAASCLGASAAPFLRALASGGRGAAEQCTRWAGLRGGQALEHTSRPTRLVVDLARLELTGFELASASPLARAVVPRTAPIAPAPAPATTPSLVGLIPATTKYHTKMPSAGAAVSAGHGRAHQPRLKPPEPRRGSMRPS